MDVSVIIPAYNVEKYIVNTLNSLLSANSKVSYEIIIINDGSTDGTDLVLKDYIAKSTQTITYISQINQGVSCARNAGLDSSVGDYIIFLDGDDFVEVNYISELFETISKQNYDIVTCMYNYYWSDGTTYCRNYRNIIQQPTEYSASQFFEYFLLNTRLIITGSLIFKASLIREQGIRFDTTITHCEDHKFFVNCIFLAKKIGLHKKILHNYYQIESSLTHRINPNKIRSRIQFYSYLRKQYVLCNKHNKIILGYNLPDALNSVFELYVTNGYIEIFNRAVKFRTYRKLLWLGILSPYNSLKRKMKYLILLINKALYTKIIHKTKPMF